MKQKDIGLIVVAVIISAVASIFLTKLIITPPKNRQQQVEVVNPITAEFNKPSSQYINSNSFNPTKLIQIGDQTNPAPFNTKQ